MKSNPLVRSGYWCECTPVRAGRTAEPPLRASFAAHGPGQAVNWIRIAIRTLIAVYDDEPFEQAWQWITTDHTTAYQTLKAGHPYALSLAYATTLTTWTIHPVLYVPLAHRQGRRLPPCTKQFFTTQLPATR